MSRPTDPAVTDEPAVAGFVHRIRVGWADCDPAAMAYTGRIPCWALDAIDAWWQEVAQLSWFELNLDRNVGTPFVHMTLDFRAPITPRHRLDCEVTLRKLGRSSIRHRVRGLQNGRLCFEGEFVSVCVVSDQLQPRALPSDLRALLEPTVADHDRHFRGEQLSAFIQDRSDSE